MCGIVGVFEPRSRRASSTLVRRMTERLLHRGPDSGAVFIDERVGLGHRRLSIIDRSGSAQPLFSEDRSICVVFNGEIYNFQALREQLIDCGHQFTTQGDTEVLVHGWEQWGTELVKRLRGMFAFAIWDRREELLFLVRDHTGIKPLYYTFLPSGGFAFASELKALLLHPECPRELDPFAVEEYLAFGYIPDPRTIYRGVSKLPPAHSLLVRCEARREVPVRYWEPRVATPLQRNEADLATELLARLEASVREQMVAEVPLGAFLSGGVDSSAVVAHMARASRDPVHTCSIRFSEAENDEGMYAEQVATRYRTLHRARTVRSDDFSLLSTISALYDEPFADSSALPTYRLCELARREVTVALSGDGGDECFAGYRSYQTHMALHRMRTMLPGALRAPLFSALGRWYPKVDWAPRPFRAKRAFEHIARDLVESFIHGAMFLPSSERHQLYTPQLRRALAGYDAGNIIREHAARCPFTHPLTLLQYLDLKVYLPGDILTKVDRASMAHSLEVRVPLLDHTLVEWALQLPPELQLQRGEGKQLFKRALEPLLPRDVLYRRKMGFEIPLREWLRGPLYPAINAALESEVLADSQLLNQKRCRTILEQHRSGARDHGSTLWSILMLERFLKRHEEVEDNRPALVQGEAQAAAHQSA